MANTPANVRMRMVAAVLLCMLTPLAAAAELSVISTINVNFNNSDFASVEALYSGPWHHYQNLNESESMETPQSERWRLLVIPPTEEGNTMLVLEKIVMGAEGCCVHVIERRNLHFSENRGFAFEQWLGPHSFTFSMRAKRYVISQLGSDNIKVTSNTN